MILPQNIPIYGDTSYRGKCPTETAEAVTLFSMIRLTYPKTLGKIAIHIKNEGKRKHSQAQWDKASGMVKGASDVMIPGSPTFVSEIKRKNHTLSKISKEQVEYLEAAKENGAFVCIALGYEAALEAIKEWVSGETSTKTGQAKS